MSPLICLVMTLVFISLTRAQLLGCQRRVFTGNNTLFVDEFGRILPCSPVGSVYEQRHCGCTSLIDAKKFSDKRPDLMISFANGSISDDNNLAYVQNIGVSVSNTVSGSMDGFVGVFSGGHLEVPYFDGMDIGARLRIEIRYLETAPINSARLNTLVTNSDIIGDGTLFMGLNSAARRTRMFIDAGVQEALEVDNPQGWKTIIFDYNAIEQSANDPAAELSVTSENGQTSTATRQMTGNILPSGSPLFIGDGSSGQAPFSGFIDHIIIWRNKQ